MRWPLRWPFHDDGAGTGAPDTVARAAAAPDAPASPDVPASVDVPAAPRRDWASLPPLQRSFDAPPLTARSGSFARAVAADATLPLALAPLGHGHDAEAPGGLVRGLATAIADRATTARTTVDVGGAVGGGPSAMPAALVGPGAAARGQQAKHAPGVPGRHVQRIMSGGGGASHGDAWETAHGGDVQGVAIDAPGASGLAATPGVAASGDATSAQTGAAEVTGIGRSGGTVSASMTGASAGAATAAASGAGVVSADEAREPEGAVGLPPVQRLHGLPVRTSASVTRQAGRHESLIAADMPLPASPGGLLRSGAVSRSAAGAASGATETGEPGPAADVQRSAGPLSGSTTVPDRPVRLSVGQVRRLGLGTPFAQAAERASSASGATASGSDLRGTRSGSPTVEARQAAAGPGAHERTTTGPVVAREVAPGPGAADDAAGRGSPSTEPDIASRLPLGETRGHPRHGTGGPDEMLARREVTGAGQNDRAEGDDAGSGEARVNPAATAGRSVASTLSATSAHAPANHESRATSSRPRLGLGTPAATPVASGIQRRSLADAAAASPTPVAQRLTTTAGAAVAQIPARARPVDAAPRVAAPGTHDDGSGIGSGTTGRALGAGTAALGSFGLSRGIAISRSAYEGTGSAAADAPLRARGALAARQPPSIPEPSRPAPAGDAPMPLVRTPRVAADSGGGFDAGGAAQPTIARSLVGGAFQPGLTDGGQTTIASLQRDDLTASAGTFPASSIPASVQREDGTDAAVAAAGSSATGGGGASAGGSERELDELARRLYDRIRSRLRTELLVDRERAGALSDLV